MTDIVSFPRRGRIGELEQMLDQLGANEQTRALAHAVARGEDVDVDPFAILDAELDARGITDPPLRELAHAILGRAIHDRTDD